MRSSGGPGPEKVAHTHIGNWEKDIYIEYLHEDILDKIQIICISEVTEFTSGGSLFTEA